MNRKYIVSIGVVVSMLSGVASAGFMYDNLDNSLGDTLTNRGNWRATSTNVVIATNTAGAHMGNAAMIPILQTLSNVVDLAGSETKVWTDFWTIPRPFVSDTDGAPTVDPNTSAMFFVTNTSWAVVYGSGGSVTSVCPNDIWSAGHTVANDGSTWKHVSVYHNYGATNWSLFVDGSPLKTNMAFISSVPNYQWFSVQNGGGNASNVTWIDDVLITNRVPASLTNDHDGQGVRDAWELMYYGTIGVVSPTADTDGDGFNNSQESQLGSNPGLVSGNEPGGSNITEFLFGTVAPGIDQADVTNAASNPIRLVFSVGSNVTCYVLGSTSPTGPFNDVLGMFRTGPGGTTNWFIDSTGAGHGQQYFYRIMATNETYGFVQSNAETYAYFKQSRILRPTVSNFWVGITIDYGASNTMGSTLGRQLARGLGLYDRLTVYYPEQSTFRLVAEDTWEPLGTVGLDAHIPLGQAVLIQRLGSAAFGGATNAVFAGALLTNTVVSITNVPGWNMLSWPYYGSNNTWMTTGLTQTNSVIWLYRNGSFKKLKRYMDGWRIDGGAVLTGSPWGYLQFGEGFFFTNSAAVGGTWTP